MIPLGALVGGCIGTGAFGFLVGMAVSATINPRENRAQRKVVALEETVESLKRKLHDVEADRDRFECGMADWARAAFAARKELFDIEKHIGAVRAGLEAKGAAPKQEDAPAT